MTTIPVEPIAAEVFAPFGRLFEMRQSASPDASKDVSVVRTDGPDWTDAYTHDPLVATNASLGMTHSGGTPFEVIQMERHPNTQEALFCAQGSIVLVVAPAGAGARPDASGVRAFSISPGTVAVMNPGVWHDACRGLHGPTSYYWMATVRTGTEWQEVVGGPVSVAAETAT
ncbi:MAG: ureidoglycolate lyase [Hyphomicrobiales bacterium]|nr:ureidoglycolate lyase [Hyphomicrobiales bacterium]